MKKYLLMSLVIVMLLVGCGSSDNQSGDANAGSNMDNGETTQSQSNQELADNSESSTEGGPYVLTFSGTTLAGEPLTSDCFADSKLTMVNVWATFCGPCINEMPDLGAIAKEYDSADFQIIGIISDVIEGDEGDTFAEAQEIIAETGADYKHLLLNEELYVNLVGASDSVPTTYFFNEKGELIGYLIGAQRKEAWMQIIEGFLAEMQ